MSEGFSGGCLCGAVRYESAVKPVAAAHCQCEDCRKSSGSGHCSHLVVPEGAFTVTGEVRFFDKAADSGNLVSRGFCPTCGSAVYSTNDGMPGGRLSPCLQSRRSGGVPAAGGRLRQTGPVLGFDRSGPDLLRGHAAA